MRNDLTERVQRIAIVGAGPAGSSLAIRLVQSGFSVVLIERDRFPRQKLCGEFISPECLAHFETLGVADTMMARGGDRIGETCFYETGGKNIAIPSDWFGGSADALSLSRAEMDFQLLERTKDLGIEVLEETRTVGLIENGDGITGLIARGASGETLEIHADLIIDATGRSALLGKLIAKTGSEKLPRQKRPGIIGFKAHVTGARLEHGRCEMYSFRGGYCGLNHVENGVANLCFLIKADAVKEFGGDAGRIVRELIRTNKRANETLQKAEPVENWLAVAVDGFGKKNLNPAPNVFSAGDAAAFVDPFTGSGMLMAFESAEILATCITENSKEAASIAAKYQAAYDRKFSRRLRMCGVLRRAAFMPRLAKLMISVLGVSTRMREFVTRATRQTAPFKENKR